MEAVKCEKLNFTYPLGKIQALKNVNLTVEKGELALIIGKSAVGKSTLMKLMKSEIAPKGEISGEIIVNGRVGYVSQNVEENIVCDKVRSELSFGLTNMGALADEIELSVAEVASYFNLESKLDNDISTLSGGEKQMVNLASVMIMKPDVLVLDEPTSQLDPISASRFIAMINQLHSDFGITVIMSIHSADEIFTTADSIILVDNATVVLKSNQHEMVEFLKANMPEMLGVVPTQMRLYESVDTVLDCRNVLKAKQLVSIDVDKVCGDDAVKIKSVSFAYKKGRDVIDALSLNIKQGSINAVIGANGCGKTTLLKVIAGVKKHYRGRIKADGKISMLCQNPFDLFTRDRCADEVEFGELTELLEIDDIKNQHPYDLSGGQAGRLALAKVIQTGADIILLDEPTKALDSALKIKLASILKQLCAQGKTIVIVSHDIEFVGEYADVVSFMSRGKIVATDDRQSFFSRLSFYTTAVARITNGIADNIVSVSDLEKSGGLN